MILKKNKGFYIRLIKATFARRSLLRFLQNEVLSNIRIDGEILDLGGSPNSQYYSYIQRSVNSKTTYADLYNKSDNFLKIDFNETFPIKKNSFDNVLIMNVIEHLESYENCIFEIVRILKKNGGLYGVVPFLFPVHMVPDDFHRPTESMIKKVLSDAGFDSIEIKPLGFGRWTAAANLCGPHIKFKLFTLIIYLIAILLDKFDSNKKKYTKGKFTYPIGYFFHAK
jgi:SAM-dependent methyltransferase